MSFACSDEAALWSFVIGKKLGEGSTRDVYVYAPNPSLVVKIEHNTGVFANVMEWRHWQDAPRSVRKWLSPAVDISGDGRVLLMKRTEPAALHELPAKCPAFIADRGLPNVGWLEGKLVCHDYAVMHYEFPTRKIKAKWWAV